MIDQHPPPLEAEHAVAALVHKSLQVCGGHLNNTLTLNINCFYDENFDCF